jgi:glyoxylase-like metal-dependent hydrolase (beta-lactamase superfamily II)
MKIRQIAQDVYQIALMPRSGINCYIADGVLIDSGIRNSYASLCAAIDRHPIRLHVLTHAHADHQGCSGQLSRRYQIPFGCHELERRSAETGRVTAAYPSPKQMIARFQQACWAGPGHPVDFLIKENDRIGQFTAIETPGHSPGHISFFRESDGLLIVGDVATNMNLLTTKEGLRLPPARFTSDLARNLVSLKKLSDLHPSVLCFGHGPVLHNTHRQFEKFVERSCPAR